MSHSRDQGTESPTTQCIPAPEPPCGCTDANQLRSSAPGWPATLAQRALSDTPEAKQAEEFLKWLLGKELKVCNFRV